MPSSRRYLDGQLAMVALALFAVGLTNLLAAATTIATGPFHACILSSGGAVRCWGRNVRAVLGSSSYDARHMMTLYPAARATL